MKKYFQALLSITLSKLDVQNFKGIDMRNLQYETKNSHKNHNEVPMIL
jgi:hypothetical protein